MEDVPGKVKNSCKGPEKRAIQRMAISVAVVQTARGRDAGPGSPRASWAMLSRLDLILGAAGAYQAGK